MMPKYGIFDEMIGNMENYCYLCRQKLINIQTGNNIKI